MSLHREFKGVWIPKEIYLDKNLTIMEKLLFTEIDSLCKEDIGCIASNSYLGEFLGIHKSGVSKLIKSLSEKGYVSVELVYAGSEVIERKIRVLGGWCKNATGGANLQQGWCNIGKGINTYTNPYSNTLHNPNTLQEKEKYKKEKENLAKSRLPEISELMEFGKAELRKLKLDESFDYHLQTKIESWLEAGGKDGHGKPIKNWKSKIKNVIPFLKPLTAPKNTPHLAKKEYVNTIPREDW